MSFINENSWKQQRTTGLIFTCMSFGLYGSVHGWSQFHSEYTFRRLDVISVENVSETLLLTIFSSEEGRISDIFLLAKTDRHFLDLLKM